MGLLVCCLPRELIAVSALWDAGLNLVVATALVPVVGGGARIRLERAKGRHLSVGQGGAEDLGVQVLPHVGNVHRAWVEHNPLLPLPCQQQLRRGEAVGGRDRLERGLFNEHPGGRDGAGVLVPVGDPEWGVRVEHNLVLVAKLYQTLLRRVQMGVEWALVDRWQSKTGVNDFLQLLDVEVRDTDSPDLFGFPQIDKCRPRRKATRLGVVLRAMRLALRVRRVPCRRGPVDHHHVNVVCVVLPQARFDLVARLSRPHRQA
mmetsp:Transcript_35056/g.91723  ORF Transcript_35056/g.91723 Transcript_35056/m.91723 type:complete len:260 (-) Transcript_35056:245-1024(-)